jgi:hypothetical protein
MYLLLKECDEYDLTAAQYFWLVDHNDSSRWFSISSPWPICCPSFSFMGGVAKQIGYITKLGCEFLFYIFFCRWRTESTTAGDALTKDLHLLHK